MSAGVKLHGLIAGFTRPEQLVEAVTRARARGFTRMDAYTPFPVEGLDEALGLKRTAMPLIVLAGGVVGAVGGYFMEWYATAVSYPINVGGRPFNSWPAYIPITFELMVLCASLSAFIGLLALNRLPQPNHPVFNAPGFERASSDRFFLCVEAGDLKFDALAVRRFLEGLDPASLSEVPA